MFCTMILPCTNFSLSSVSTRYTRASPCAAEWIPFAEFILVKISLLVYAKFSLKRNISLLWLSITYFTLSTNGLTFFSLHFLRRFGENRLLRCPFFIARFLFIALCKLCSRDIPFKFAGLSSHVQFPSRVHLIFPGLFIFKVEIVLSIFHCAGPIQHSLIGKSLASVWSYVAKNQLAFQ